MGSDTNPKTIARRHEQPAEEAMRIVLKNGSSNPWALLLDRIFYLSTRHLTATNRFSRSLVYGVEV